MEKDNVNRLIELTRVKSARLAKKTEKAEQTKKEFTYIMRRRNIDKKYEDLLQSLLYMKDAVQLGKLNKQIEKIKYNLACNTGWSVGQTGAFFVDTTIYGSGEANYNVLRTVDGYQVIDYEQPLYI